MPQGGRELDSARVHPDIRKLLQVQRVDQKLARIRRDLDSLPREEARRRQRLDQARAAQQRAKEELDRAEVESRAHDKNIRGADEEIKKLTVRLNTVRNNAEYQATLFQIESVKRERSRIEEEALALLDRLEGLRQAVADAKAQADEEDRTFTEFLGEAEAVRSSRADELAAAGRGRDELIAEVPPDLLQKYETLFQVRDSVAVCAVEGQVCTGCYTSLTPNDMARLLGTTSVVQCGSCQRLLYLNEG